MKLALAGQSYSDRSVAAAAQQCVNLYAETIEDPAGSGKSVKILRGTPGYHLLVNLNGHAGNVRGFWSGGSRCFVVVGAWTYEINNAGGIVPGSSYNMVVDDHLPVQFFGNGHQLGLITAGIFLINNGAGWTPALFQIQGTVKAVGAALTWASGAKFTPAMAGINIYVSGHIVSVATYTDTTHISLTAPLGGGVGFVMTYYADVFLVSGDPFTYALAGSPITINGVVYNVLDVESSTVLHLADRSAGDQVGPGYLGVPYSAVQANLTYSAAAGDPVTAVTGAYLDGSFFVQRPSPPPLSGLPDLGRQVNFSAGSDGTVWNGLDFFTKEGAPDYIQSIFADREQLYVFGTETTEIWQNDLNTGRPVRLNGAVAKEGSAARYAVVSMQQHIYFLGGSPGGGVVAYRVDGFTPTRISTHAVEEDWATNGDFVSTAIAWWYLEDGHYFFVVCAGGGNATTWVYDATEKFWHERKLWSPGAGGNIFNRDTIQFHTFIPEWSFPSGSLNGAHIVGDGNSSKVYVMSSAYYDNDGADVKRVRALPYIYNEDRRVFVDRVQLAMDTGEIPSGAEPVVTLEWSADNGHTFSTPDPAGFGLAGDFDKRVFWIAQGSFETAAIPRISVTGQTAVTLIDMTAEVAFGAT